jgi:hypothetical protein
VGAGDVLIALDQSPTKTGFAVGAANAPPVLHGACTFPDGIVRLRAWREFLRDKIGYYRPVTIVCETPFAGTGDVRGMYGIAEVIRCIAEEHGLAYHELTCKTWRDHFIGKERPDDFKQWGVSKRRTWYKKQSKHACRARGWKVWNDDEADALGILDAALWQLFPEHSPSLRYRDPIK